MKRKFAGGVLLLLALAANAWTADNVLPDFSHAGYQGRGVPAGTPIVNVRDHGAVGDGLHDDLAAFNAAIAAAGPHVVFIPEGKYSLSGQVRITRPGVVLRGEGPGRTVLLFPRSLTKAVGRGDRKEPGGSWSWSGGFVSVEGGNTGRRLSAVTAPAERGATTLAVSSASAFLAGQNVRLVLVDGDGSLGRHLHADQADAAPSLLGKTLIDFSCQIVAVASNSVTINRPLRTDVRLPWNPVLLADQPTVDEVGIEKLSVIFPDLPYAGHHREPGFNAFNFERVSNAWIDDVTIVNADAAVILRSGTKFCRVRGVTLASHGNRATKGVIGHHGFLVADLSQDNLISEFRINGRFVHDLCVSSLVAGNVFMKGRGDDMTFDHHRKAPFENLFTEINAGRGSGLWLSGGDEDAGPHSGARETFWNITTALPPTAPPWAIEFTFEPARLTPPNLYESQLLNRRRP